MFPLVYPLRVVTIYLPTESLTRTRIARDVEVVIRAIWAKEDEVRLTKQVAQWEKEKSETAGNANKSKPKATNYPLDVTHPKTEYSKILIFVNQAKHAEEMADFFIGRSISTMVLSSQSE